MQRNRLNYSKHRTLEFLATQLQQIRNSPLWQITIPLIAARTCDSISCTGYFSIAWSAGGKKRPVEEEKIGVGR